MGVRSHRKIMNYELRIRDLKSKIVNLKSPILSLLTAYCLLLTVFSNAGHAKIYIDIHAPGGKRLPIAVPDINIQGNVPDTKNRGKGGAQSDISAVVRDTLVHDLEFSGFFNIIDKKAYIEENSNAKTQNSNGKDKIDKKSYDDIDFKDWRIIGADALIKGAIAVEGENLTAELKLFDTFQAKMLAGRRYIGKRADIRKIAHRFTSEAIEALTGEKGIFNTKFMFVSGISGSKDIYMADYDGYNLEPVVRNNSINLSPQWSPDGGKILYTSYKDGWPYLYMMELATRRETRLSSQAGVNIGARWSPSGNEIALTLSKDGNPELYILELNGMKLKRLTDNWAIDVSPAWSPDAKRLAFVSDRGGNPHIYMINSDGTGLIRITYEGKYNAAPAWSPKGDKIAFVRRNEGKFDIWTMNADGTEQIQLTLNGRDNEDPSWSPDGRYIIFTSTGNGAAGIYIMRDNGADQRRIEIKGGDKGIPASPVWSPYVK